MFCTIALLLLLVRQLIARCPNWCNQRGECSSPDLGGICVCHKGFTGEDCSQRYCPHGFDPTDLDLLTDRRTIRLETGHMGGKMMGKIEFSFGDSSVYLNADAKKLDSSKCQEGLKGLKSVEEVSCLRENVNEETGVGSYVISLLNYPEKPFLNNLVTHDGNPSISMFHCNMSKVDEEEAASPFCSVSDVIVDGIIPKYLECSNHGTCDRVKGECKCQRGYNGISCGDTRDNTDIVYHEHDGPFFSATLLKVNALRKPDKEFNLFQTQIEGKNVTSLTGDRRLLHRGQVNVHSGGVRVSDSSEEDIFNIEDSYIPTNFESHITQKPNQKNPDPQSKKPAHFSAFHDQNKVFSLDLHGHLDTAGDLTAANGSFLVTESLVSAVSMELAGDLKVEGSLQIEGSIDVVSGFSISPDGVKIDTSTLSGSVMELRAGEKDFSGILLDLQCSGEGCVMLRTTAQDSATFEVLSDGMIHTKGMRLKSGGIEVEAGGVQILSGGLEVKGGITLESGALSLPSQELEVGKLKAFTSEETSKGPLLQAHTSSAHFSGPLLELSLTTDLSTGTPSTDLFSFLQCKTENSDSEESVAFEVSGTGFVSAAGGALFSGRVTVEGETQIGGGFNLVKTAIHPEEKGNGQGFIAMIPDYVTYAEIVSVEENNDQIEVIIEGADGSPPVGKILIVTNRGTKPTSGAIRVPPQSTIMFIWDGLTWVGMEALKVPVHELKNVETFEAVADLDMGNHTFSAGRLRASRMQKGSIVVVGPKGIFTDHEMFTFTPSKGLLSTPALKVDRLVSTLDCKGNELSNAFLTNAQLSGARIRASEIILTSSQASGLAFFDEQGKLGSSDALKFDSQNRLLISELNGDLNLNGHRLNNLTISDAIIKDIELLQVESMAISGLNAPAGSLLLVTSTVGEITAAPHPLSGSNSGADKGSEKGPPKGISVDLSTGAVLIGELKVDRVSDKVDFKGNQVRNAVFQGGKIEGMEEIRTDSLVVEDLKDVEVQEGKSKIVLADPNGRLIVASDPSNPVEIPSLLVHSLHFQTDEIDFGGTLLKNVLLDSGSIDFGSSKQLQAENLKGFDAENRFLTADTNGIITVMPMGLNVRKKSKDSDELDLSVSGKIEADELISKKIRILDMASKRFLGSNDEGEIAPLSEGKLDSIEIEKLLSFSDSARVKWDDLPTGLLAVDAKGFLVSLGEGKEENRLDLSVGFNVMKSQRVEVGKGDFQSISANELFLSSGDDKNDNNKDDNEKYNQKGNILLIDKSGKLITTPSNIRIDITTSTLHIPNISPTSPQDTLQISSALLTHSNLTHATILSSPSITTESLVVTGLAELQGGLVVDGSVTVNGPVIGSGPYVDSSDGRFKKNVRNVTNALDIVTSLQAVRYEFDREQFPEKSFPAEVQIGWIADSLEEKAPELVSTDSQGFKMVSYAHSTALIAEAVKEMKLMFETEMKDLKNEVAELKKRLNEKCERN